jgi:hypothetical protein
MWLINSADDDEFSAHNALIGNFNGLVAKKPSIKTTFTPKPDAIANNLVGQNGQACKIQDACVSKPEDSKANHCPSGWLYMGWEKGKCGVSIALDYLYVL